ncbi:UDP-2,3-diacylglucosamine diphosphatase [Thiocystis violacea]|uniref:UDP-2,3-diacylglucosamine diphosphatase n=1 Tax=Thiocystis violacea TaxID=13725 RepID=UPI0019054E30|nr:UDP-2,3-diacylglucosamine diphosphatase [Thiocystis violacea]MBK1719785.1 UDP-2,3-diacylglucosamine diphosphatase [Thiocystis violacea]
MAGGRARDPRPAEQDVDGESLFISDLHLSPERPATLGLFLDFLAGRARAARRLYILGDLFDAWIGDDDETPMNLRVRSALRALVESGTQCALMHGNRDFLIGRAFLRETGCRLLGDPTLLHFDGEPTLLMHGDRLCTDDLAYQKFRRRVRNPLVIRLFLWKSLASRRALAADYRRKSAAANSDKSSEIMDVSQDSVRAHLERHRAIHLIHGHTHRPADHEIALDGRIARRTVLAEWHEQAGEALSHSSLGWHREPILPTLPASSHSSALDGQ